MSFSRTNAIGVRELHCQRGSIGVRAGDLDFVRGGFHVLRGTADSGHELLLRVLGLLEPPGAGEVLVEGLATRELTDDARLKLRERRLGFVFTAPFLLPAFTVIENVAMPLFKISEVDTNEARLRSEVLLEFVGLADLSGTPCTEITPLEQHGVSLARALVNEPAALLVENLEGALAEEDLRTFMTTLRRAATRLGVAMVVAVSPDFIPETGDRVIDVIDGRATASELSPSSDA